jgi:hypothetical protein
MSRRRAATTLDRMGGATPAAAVSLAAIALALSAGGCTEDFPPFNRLDSLRVLAIQSEPAAPLTGQTATLTPLVFTPIADPSLTYQWSWCPAPGPAASGRRCLITEDELAALLGPGVPFPPFDLGAAPTAMLEAGLPPALLAAVCGGAVANVPRPNCAGGFPVQVSLTVRTDTDQVDAVVTARWRFDEATQAPNTNPSVDSLTATLAGGQAQPITDTLVDDTITIPRDVETEIDAVVAREASETYDGLDDADIPATLRERLFITWFVETGHTDDTRTSYIPDATPFEDMLRNAWAPEADRLYPRDDARLFVVLHDNRGGVGWRSGIVRLEPNP